MARIRSRDTKPELAVRRILARLGYRFRTNVRALPARPDVVFSRRKIALFVHGCFWHRHHCRFAYTPNSRVEFWSAKFAANIARDKRVEEAFTEAGWKVVVIWACELENANRLETRLVQELGPIRWP